MLRHLIARKSAIILGPKWLSSSPSGPCRFFSPSCLRTIREIQITETEKAIVIEGVEQPSGREPYLVQVPTPAHGCSDKCHPLCKLEFVHEIKYTDVLILHQFMSKTGTIIEREVTGLCARQHKRMEKLIKMAQKAGLMPHEQDIYWDRKQERPWERLNSYWDEKTIDTQWLENEKRSKARSFKS